MSKSRGNVVDPFQALEEFGKDVLRYFLLKEGSLHNDGGVCARGRRIMCVCVCVCVCVHASVHACVHACVCGVAAVSLCLPPLLYRLLE